MNDSHIFSSLSHKAKVMVFCDLVQHMKLDLAKQIYEQLDLTQTDLVWQFIDSYYQSPQFNHYVFDEKFNSQIDDLILNTTKNSLLTILNNNQDSQTIINEINCFASQHLYLHSKNFHDMVNLYELMPKELHNVWFSQMCYALNNQIYIHFNQQNSWFLDKLDALHVRDKVNLLAQSNAYEFLNLSGKYFEKSKTSHFEFEFEAPRVENTIYCHDFKVAIVLKALLHVNQPHFDKFLESFNLTKKEFSLLENSLTPCCLFDIENNKLHQLLTHYNASLSSLLNNQLKSYYDDSFHIHDLGDIFKDLETLKQWIPFLDQEDKKIKIFSEAEFLLFNFRIIDSFFELNKGFGHFTEFLKATSFCKNSSNQKNILKKLYKIYSTEPEYGYDNYGLELKDIETYLSSIEKEILNGSFNSFQTQSRIKKIKI
jgi:hypothetical protein